MFIMSIAACGAVMLGAAGLDEPKAFLVVGAKAGQTVVDAGAWTPDRNDYFKSVDAGPADGIANWSGTRLATTREVPGALGRAVFVMDLAQGGEGAARQASQPARGLELIGWMGTKSRVVVRDGEGPGGQMLRIVGAQLAKDSNLEFGTDITERPGEYREVVVSRRDAVAYFSVEKGGRGRVMVWRDGASVVVAEDVEASALCWSPQGDTLAVAERGRVTVYDTSPPAKGAAFALPEGCRGEPAWITSMAWKPDGTSVALLPDWPTPDHMPNNPRVWSLDVKSGACVVMVNLTYPATGVRWMDSGGCTTSLDEACEQAKKPVVGQRP